MMSRLIYARRARRRTLPNRLRVAIERSDRPLPGFGILGHGVVAVAVTAPLGQASIDHLENRDPRLVVLGEEAVEEGPDGRFLRRA